MIDPYIDEVVEFGSPLQNWNTLDSRSGRYFIGPIYFTWFDFLSKVRPIFSLRFAQGLGTDLVKLLIFCYPAQGAQIMRDN